MVEKGARTTLNVLDVPFAILVPELAVPSTHNLALKPYGRRRRHVAGDIGLVVSFRVSAYADHFIASWERTRDGGELEGRASSTGVVKGAESDRGEDVGARASWVGRQNGIPHGGGTSPGHDGGVGGRGKSSNSSRSFGEGRIRRIAGEKTGGGRRCGGGGEDEGLG